MLRNLLASAIILAASTSAFAGIAEDLKIEGATSDSVVTAAMSACADADCKTAVLEEAIAAGVDANSIMTLGLAAGIDAQAISTSLRTANVPESEIVAAAIANNIDPTTITASTAGGPVTQGNNANEGLEGATEVPGISPGA